MWVILLLMPLASSASECFVNATRILEVLKPIAEKVGQVSLERVVLSKGIFTTMAGQKDEAFAEYSRGSIYLYGQFCQQAEAARIQILAHELGHAIDDAKGKLDGMTWELSGVPVPWEQRRSEKSANQWMKKILDAIWGGIRR
ncbi:MAG: hypothetical protein ACKVN9_10135 [Methylophilaceae bacterium]